MSGGTGPAAAGAPVFSIPAAAPFLPTLADALLSGALWPDGRPPADPLALAGATVFLPTRRAARAFADTLVDRSPAGSLVLPAIRALGDLDGVGDEPPDEPEAALEPPGAARALGDVEARLALAGLVEGWGRHVHPEQLELLPGGRVAVPQSPADAIRLSADLLALMEEVEREELDWSHLHRLAPDDLARYWQITLQFLSIAMDAWPRHLEAIGAISPALRRRRLIDAEAARLARERPGAPVVVAGSTGSVPATARLMKTVAGLPAGTIVLPGLDGDMDAADRAALDNADPPAVEHPQHGLMRLLGDLGIAREAVRRLGPAPPAAAALRARAVSRAMRPAATTDRWRADAAALAAHDLAGAFSGVALVEAADEREEALAVAVGLRQAVAEGATAALVTPDRALARRVAGELLRWRIEADDSAGLPLGATEAGVVARLVAEVATARQAATFLSLLKHPLATLGLEEGLRRAGVAAIEHRILRKGRVAGGPAALQDAVRQRGAAVPEAAHVLAAALADALAPLAALSTGPATPQSLGDAHREATARVLGGEEALAALAERRDGRALVAAFDAVAGAPSGDFRTGLADWPGVFEALVGDTTVRPEPTAWLPRVAVLGPLEARLQRYDRLFVGGLSEGTWPQAAENGPWMSRGMVQAFGLERPERRVGLQAHDVSMALAGPGVVLSRSRRKGDAPVVPSRWLQRMDAVLGEAITASMRERGGRLLALAHALDRPDASPKPATRPEPAPPLAARPKELTVTDIARLIRDPYAVYAHRILRLRELDPLDPLPGPADRGTLIHRILAAFVAEDGPRAGEAGVHRFLALAERHLAAHADAPAFLALWRPRMEPLARAFVAFEEARAAVAASHAEVDGRIAVPTPAGPIALVCRADRIDVAADGTCEIIDYKTGATPTKKQVDANLEPQLPLEGLVLARGGFEATGQDARLGALTYVSVRNLRDPLEARPAGDDAPAALVEEAGGRLEALLSAYAREQTGYLSRARLLFGRTFDQPYDHLARAQEWADTGLAEEE